MEERGIRKVKLTSEMKNSFMQYAMSVIVSRALPDVRDGLKPVQRRIIYGMSDLGCTPGTPYKKSARIVGEVMGKYHPHGDSSICEEQEPAVLPARIPNLLINGSTGIAVGMATNIPPHNLVEVIEAILAVAKDPDITIMELMENYIQGPDFPTGGYILGKTAIKKAYEVNKARMIEKMSQLVREKKIEGITEIRDESNRDGIRVVIELRRDIQPEVILNQLYKLTSLQTTFGANCIALVNNEPKTLNLKEMITLYLDHQEEVIKRRTKFRLTKAEDRAHILEGLKRALDQIDAIIDLIRSSRTTEIIQTRLMEEFNMSDKQAKAIREMQLQRLAGLERQKIEDDLNKLLEIIADLKDILENRERLLSIIHDELEEIKDKYGDKRRTEIIQGTFDLEDEDLIPVEDVIISLTNNGYVKRMPVDTYKTQNRGGRGIKGMATNSDDIVSSLINMSTHDDLLFFTNFGKVYRLKGYNIPEFGRSAKGLPVVNLLNLDKEEQVKSMISINRKQIEENNDYYLFFVTASGLVKRVHINEFERIRQSGKIAISLRDDDQLVSVKLTGGNDQILIAASNGKLVRFEETNVRPMGRSASGVKGINVDGSEVIGMTTDKEGKYIMVVTERGYGKMSPLEEYRLSNRGGKGVKTINATERNGQIVALRAVNGDEDLLIITDDGIMIRLPMEQVKTAGRATQGVRLIKVNAENKVSSVEVVEKAAETEEDKSEEE